MGLSLTQHLLDHVGFLPLVAQEVGGDACENDAAADQAFKRGCPEGHGDHEDAAQNKSYGDEQWNLQEDRSKIAVIYQKCQCLPTVIVTT